ncbi:MAG: hypothetical protein QM527_05465 [Alphaproteobacteria bacterium]|nr:hypothetical protein [Alphaproteobacteria bacterium]
MRELPAQAIAQQAQAYWRAHTTCPLRYLSGDTTMAGIISIYSGHHLLVLEDNDPAKSPWIDLADMRQSGYLAISVNSSPEPVTDALVIPLVLRKHQNQTNPPHSDMVIRFVPPEDCEQGI